MVCHDPIAPKLTKSLGPWERPFSRPGILRRGPWSQLTYPIIQLFCWANSENFSLFHAADQKLFHFYCQTDTQTDTQTDRQTDKQTNRHTDTQTDRHTDRHTDRQTHRQTDTQTDRHTYTHLASLCAWVRFFSIWNFIPFTTLQSFVCFGHSLTSFVKDKIEFKFKYVLFSESTPKPFRQPCVYILASLLWLLSKSLCEYCKLFY